MTRLLFFFASFALFFTPAHAQQVIPLTDIGGLHSAYVVPRDNFNRVDVQLIVLSGTYDDPVPSGTAHFVEHLAAFSADAYVLRQPRERDLFAKTTAVATIYTNSGTPKDIDRLMKLSRALLDTPKLPKDFLESEIKIVQRETHLRERRYPTRWLNRLAIQNLYGSKRGRANNVVEDLPLLNLKSALEFHNKHYAASNITVVISGKISPELAAQKVSEYFGDTPKTKAPEKWWLDEKPAPDLRVVKEISSPRLADNVMVYTKFVDLKNFQTSIDLQGTFFIGASIYESRIRKALIFDELDFMSLEINSYLAKNGDLEFSAFVIPMPHVSFEQAYAKFENTIAHLLDEPLTAEEIDIARQKNAVSAQSASRRPQSFLYFLENVASDGLPPLSPGEFATLIEETTDEEVIDFIKSFSAPSATSTVFASKED